jgi:DNA-binding NarL/FixJ family response regulator
MTLKGPPGSVPPTQGDWPKRRILLVDSQPIFRESLRLIVDRDATFEVVGDVGTATEALALVDSIQPGVIVTEFALPDRSGMQFISELHSHWPDLGILVLTALGPSACSAAARRSGALACIPKSCGSSELLRAIGQVAHGRKYVSPSLQLRRRRAAEPAQLSSGAPATLTARQRQVLRCVALGYNNMEIGQMLGISAKTVSKHRSRLRNTLRLPNTAGLTRYALREGLVPEM